MLAYNTGLLKPGRHVDNDPTNDGTPAEEEQEVSEQSGVEPFDDTNLDNFLHPEDRDKSWFRHLHSNTDYKTGNIGRQIRGFTERHGFASEEEARKFFMDVYQGKRGQGRNYRQRFKTALKEHHMADGTPPPWYGGGTPPPPNRSRLKHHSRNNLLPRTSTPNSRLLRPHQWLLRQ